MVNLDAAFDEDEGCGSVGVIIRDSTGEVLAAAHNFVPHLVDAPMAEAYALKEINASTTYRVQQVNYAIRLYGGRRYIEGWMFHGEFGSRLI